jgi:predicted nucleic acid-binding protein
LILDAGGVIAFERGDRRALARIAAAIELEEDVVIPAVVLAQTWRGGARQARVARLLKGCLVDDLDEDRARQIGELLGATGGEDVPDGHVAVLAAERRVLVLTSDPDDLRRLVPDIQLERV